MCDAPTNLILPLTLFNLIELYVNMSSQTIHQPEHSAPQMSRENSSEDAEIVEALCARFAPATRLHIAGKETGAPASTETVAVPETNLEGKEGSKMCSDKIP
ncbi:hypothetical protein AcW1_003820 [Taiwanofungus camphoratus]|nr:hypothetical protein AcV5_002227 [Antrodia cinnamomea]KAI0937743.1 hypothetical protein AcW1_003820 [Antrodia cinnamomea]KAI0944100.1 hypothetical protein AcV7_002015 [Antrodia cinnamomea]